MADETVTLPLETLKRLQHALQRAGQTGEALTWLAAQEASCAEDFGRTEALLAVVTSHNQHVDAACELIDETVEAFNV